MILLVNSSVGTEISAYLQCGLCFLIGNLIIREAANVVKGKCGKSPLLRPFFEVHITGGRWIGLFKQF